MQSLWLNVDRRLKPLRFLFLNYFVQSPQVPAHPKSELFRHIKLVSLNLLCQSHRRWTVLIWWCWLKISQCIERTSPSSNQTLIGVSMYKKRRNGGLQRVSFQSLTVNKLSQASNTENQRAKAALLASSSLLSCMLKGTPNSQQAEQVSLLKKL